ncbi:MAG TPA: RNA-guided pseudouridylation complex pseudouridine synthase subunit Cbf5, partial [Candidatus Altiarchaeales archaeon]|nr:RNA-guided pseudouridylation complex pseudouridine synthase subunit Cbf5 [Candidatus Altiarchaeales archaeon]
MDAGQNILVKTECETNPKYGRTPSDRTIAEYIHKGFV